MLATSLEVWHNTCWRRSQFWKWDTMYAGDNELTRDRGDRTIDGEKEVTIVWKPKLIMCVS